MILPKKNSLSKGQLIWKGLFGVFNSPKERTKNVYPSRLGQKFVFGRIEDNKKGILKLTDLYPTLFLLQSYLAEIKSGFVGFSGMNYQKRDSLLRN